MKLPPIKRAYFPPVKEVTVCLHQHISGSPIGEFVAAKFADGKIIGKWED